MYDLEWAEKPISQQLAAKSRENVPEDVRVLYDAIMDLKMMPLEAVPREIRVGTSCFVRRSELM